MSDSADGTWNGQDIEYHRYIILGAGPAGLQIAHYLESAGRDYVILDKADQVGSFFAKYPRFRQLISLNKPYTGSDHLDFVLRHDWNSLLSEPSHSGLKRTRQPDAFGSAHTDRADAAYAGGTNSTSGDVAASALTHGMLMKHFSGEYYPGADELVQLLQSYASLEGLTERLYLHTSADTVDAFIRSEWDAASVAHIPSDARYVVNTVATDDDEQGISGLWACRYLLVATGLTAPLTAATALAGGAELAQDYTTLSANISDYVGEKILILGRGNAAMEVATNLQAVAAQIHVAGPGRRLRLAWETHYPGDIRQTHNRLLESYQLKAMDGLIEVNLAGMVLASDPRNPSKIWVTDAAGARNMRTGAPVCDGCPFRKPYDRVISCLGWKHDASIFTERLQVVPASGVGGSGSASGGPGGPSGGAPATAGSSDKYPAITSQYELLHAPGVFVVGTQAHSRDWKKTSGGFIHGFRYAIRAVHRLLEQRERADAEAAAVAAARTKVSPPAHPPAFGWPRVPLHHVRAVASAIMTRANKAGGIFQMFGTLADVILLSPDCAWSHGITPDMKLDPQADYLDPIARDTPLLNARSFPSAALCGWLFEEVPIAAVPALAAQWAQEEGLTEDASTGNSTHFYSYLTLTLEFSANASKPGADPFRLDRAHVPIHHPDRSNFLHPVLRYYDSRVHVQHQRPEPGTPGMPSKPWWQRTAGPGDVPPGSSPQQQQQQQQRQQAQPQRPGAPAMRSEVDVEKQAEEEYKLSQKEAADEAVDVAEWTRAAPLAKDAPKILRKAAAAAVGPRPAGFLNPVTEFHVIEDFLNEFDDVNRHIAPLLRFLEHLSLSRALVAERIIEQEDDAGKYVPLRQIMAAPVPHIEAAARMKAGAAIAGIKRDVARRMLEEANAKAKAVRAMAPRDPDAEDAEGDGSTQEEDEEDSSTQGIPREADPFYRSPYAYLPAVDRYLPAYPVGYLTTSALAQMHIPTDTLVQAVTSLFIAAAFEAEQQRGAGSSAAGATSADGVPRELPADWRAKLWWHPVLVWYALQEAGARAAHFAHEHPETQDHHAAFTVLNIMARPGPVLLYKSDYEMRRYWYAPEDPKAKHGNVLTIRSGSTWFHTLPIPMRDGVLYNAPGARVVVLLFHAGIRSGKDGQDEEAHQQQQAAANSNKDMVTRMLKTYATKYPQLPFIEINLAESSRGGDGSVPVNIGELIASGVGIDHREIPCLAILVDRSQASRASAGRAGDSSPLDLHTVPLAGKETNYLDGALRARLMMAQRRANITIVGLPEYVDGYAIDGDEEEGGRAGAGAGSRGGDSAGAGAGGSSGYRGSQGYRVTPDGSSVPAPPESTFQSSSSSSSPQQQQKQKQQQPAAARVDRERDERAPVDTAANVLLRDAGQEEDWGI